MQNLNSIYITGRYIIQSKQQQKHLNHPKYAFIQMRKTPMLFHNKAKEAEFPKFKYLDIRQHNIVPIQHILRYNILSNNLVHQTAFPYTTNSLPMQHKPPPYISDCITHSLYKLIFK